MRSTMSFVVGLLVFPFVLIALSLAGADEFEVPNTFLPRTPARADEVNENFAALGEALNDTQDLVESLRQTRRYVSVAAVTMQPADHTMQFDGKLFFLRTLANSLLGPNLYFAHVDLPQGARIRGLRAEGEDTDPVREFEVRLTAYEPDDESVAFPITERATSGLAATPGRISLWAPPAPHADLEVDNANRVYVVHLWLPPAGQGALGALRVVVELE